MVVIDRHTFNICNFIVDALNDKYPGRFASNGVHYAMNLFLTLFSRRMKERVVLVRKLLNEHIEDGKAILLNMMFVHGNRLYNPFWDSGKTLEENEKFVVDLFDRYIHSLILKHNHFYTTLEDISTVIRDDVEFFVDKLTDIETALFQKMVNRIANRFLRGVSGKIENIKLLCSENVSFLDGFIVPFAHQYYDRSSVVDKILRYATFNMHRAISYSIVRCIKWDSTYSYMGMFEHINHGVIQDCYDHSEDSKIRFRNRIHTNPNILSNLQFIRASVDGKDTLFKIMMRSGVIEKVDDSNPYLDITKGRFDFGTLRRELLSYISANNQNNQFNEYIKAIDRYLNNLHANSIPIIELICSTFQSVIKYVFDKNLVGYIIECSKCDGFEHYRFNVEQVNYFNYKPFVKNGSMSMDVIMRYSCENCDVEDDIGNKLSCSISGNQCVRVHLYEDESVSNEDCLIHIFKDHHLADNTNLILNHTPKIINLSYEAHDLITKEYALNIIKICREKMRNNRKNLDELFRLMIEFVKMKSSGGRRVFFNGDLDEFMAEIFYSYGADYGSGKLLEVDAKNGICKVL